MFPNQPKKPKAPKGSKESWVVRYRGGRKPFDTAKEAEAFSDAQDATDGGWSEITHSIETVVRARK